MKQMLWFIETSWIRDNTNLYFQKFSWIASNQRSLLNNQIRLFGSDFSHLTFRLIQDSCIMQSNFSHISGEFNEYNNQIKQENRYYCFAALSLALNKCSYKYKSVPEWSISTCTILSFFPIFRSQAVFRFLSLN